MRGPKGRILQTDCSHSCALVQFEWHVETIRVTALRVEEIFMRRLQLAGAAEGSEGKSEEEKTDGDGKCDEPVGGISSPCAEGGIEPAESEHGKHGTNYFVEELFRNTPKTPEASWFGGVRDACRCDNCRHLSSLTHNAARC